MQISLNPTHQFGQNCQSIPSNALINGGFNPRRVKSFTAIYAEIITNILRNLRLIPVAESAVGRESRMSCAMAEIAAIISLVKSGL